MLLYRVGIVERTKNVELKNIDVQFPPSATDSEWCSHTLRDPKNLRVAYDGGPASSTGSHQAVRPESGLVSLNYGLSMPNLAECHRRCHSQVHQDSKGSVSFSDVAFSAGL